MKERLSHPVIFQESFEEVSVKGASWKPLLFYKVESNAVYGILPKGTYYIGDILKIMNPKIMQEIWGDIFHYENGIYKTSNGDYFAIGSTYEFSELKDSTGKLYSCDSGCIGIISEAIVDSKRLLETTTGLSYHIFSNEIQVLFNTSGFNFFSEGERPIKIYI